MMNRARRIETTDTTSWRLERKPKRVALFQCFTGHVITAAFKMVYHAKAADPE
jgi:hypothetical protein